MTVKLDRLDRFLKIAYDTVYHEPNTPNFHDPLIKQIYDDILSKMNMPEDYAILDVGCGSGYFLSLLKQEGFTNALGITYDAKDLEECKLLEVNASISDFTFTDFADNQFDFVWCRQAIEHSTWPFFTLLEFNRILKKGHKAYIEVPAPDTSRLHEANENHFAVMGEKMWIELFKRAGFSVDFNEAFEFGMTEAISHGIYVNHTEKFFIFMLTKEKDLVKS